MPVSPNAQACRLLSFLFCVPDVELQFKVFFRFQDSLRFFQSSVYRHFTQVRFSQCHFHFSPSSRLSLQSLESCLFLFPYLLSHSSPWLMNVFKMGSNLNSKSSNALVPGFNLPLFQISATSSGMFFLFHSFFFTVLTFIYN